MSSVGTELSSACDALETGRFEEALQIVERAPAANGVVAESVSLTAHGLMLEREGNAAEADRCFQRVFAEGVPLPALLRQCGRYFKRNGKFDEAYQCYSVLQNFAPHAISEFLSGLPPSELTRYSPSVVRQMLARPQPLFYSMQPIKEALVGQLGPEDAAVAYAEMAGLEPGWDLARMRVVGLRDFAKEHGHVYEELSPGGLVDQPPLPVLRGGAAAGHAGDDADCLLHDPLGRSRVEQVESPARRGPCAA